jgi:hypothetical protein
MGNAPDGEDTGMARIRSTRPHARLPADRVVLLVAWERSEPFLSLSPIVVEGRVEQVLLVRNPDELRGLALPPGDTA